MICNIRRNKFVKINLYICLVLFFQPIYSMQYAETIRTAATLFIDKVCPILVDAISYLQILNTVEDARQKIVSDLDNSKTHSITLTDLASLNNTKSQSISTFTQNIILELGNQQVNNPCVSNSVATESIRSTCPDNLVKDPIVSTQCLPPTQIGLPKTTAISLKIPLAERQQQTLNVQLSQAFSLSDAGISSAARFQDQIEQNAQRNYEQLTAIPFEFRANVTFYSPKTPRIIFTAKECLPYVQNLNTYIDIVLKSNSKDFSQRIAARFALLDSVNFNGLINSQTQLTKDLTTKLISIYFDKDGKVLLNQNDENVNKFIVRSLQNILNQPEMMNSYKFAERESQLLENLAHLKQFDFGTSYSSANLKFEQLPLNFQEQAKYYKELFHHEVSDFNKVLTGFDFQAGKQHVIKAPTQFQKEVRLRLLYEAFTSQGFLKKCTTDPIYQALSDVERNYISSNNQSLTNFNKLLSLRHLMLLKNVNLFILGNDSLSFASSYIENASPDTLKVLYKLVDCVNDRNAQIDVLSEVCQNPKLYNEFYSDGILKFCKNRYELAYTNDHLQNIRYQRLLVDYSNIAKNIKDPAVVKVINKLVYLDCCSPNNEKIGKVRDYVFCYLGKNKKVDSIEGRLYFEYSKHLIDGLFNKEIAKSLLNNIPELSAQNAGQRIKNLQFIAAQIDKITDNKNDQLKKIRAFILTENTSMHPYELVNAYKWVGALKCSPESKLKAKECLDNILACEITLKNKDDLSKALYNFDQTSKSNTQKSIDDNLTLACQKVSEVEKSITVLNQDIPHDKEKIVPVVQQESETQKINNIIKDIVVDCKSAERKNSKLKQYVKTGGFTQAKIDFNKLKPSDIRTLGKKEIGDLSDGRVANVRPGSTFKVDEVKVPTLEIYNPITKKSIKIRYEI